MTTWKSILIAIGWVTIGAPSPQDTSQEKLARHYLAYADSILGQTGAFASVRHYYDMALDIALKAGNDTIYVDALNGIGACTFISGAYEQGMTIWEEAIGIGAGRIGQLSYSVGALHNNLGYAHNQFGHHGLAEEHYQKCLEAWKVDAPQHFRDYIAVVNNRAKNLEEMGRLVEAELEYMRAVDLAMDSLGPTDYHTGEFCNNFGAFYLNADLPYAALPWLEKAMVVANSTHGLNARFLPTLISNMAHGRNALGDHSKAITYGELALQLHERMANPVGIFSARHNLSIAHARMRNLDVAMHLARQNITTTKVVSSAQLLSEAYQQMAYIAMITEDLDAALLYNDSALSTLSRLNRLVPFEAFLHGTRGDILFRAGRYSEALFAEMTSYEKNQRFLPYTQIDMYQSMTDIYICHVWLGNYDEAEKWRERTLQAVFGRVDELNMYGLDELTEEPHYRVLMGIGDGHYERFKRDTTQFEQLVLALHALEGASRSQEREFQQMLRESALVRAASRYDLDGLAMACAYRLFQITKDKGYLAKVFELMGHSKSLVMTRELSKRERLSVAGVPDSILEQHSALRRKAALIKHQSDSTSPVDLTFVLLKQDELERQMAEQYPKYHSLIYPPSMTLYEAQAILADDEALIEYFYDDGVLFILAVRTDTAAIRFLRTQTLDSLAQHFRQNVTDASAPIDQLISVAQSIYATALAPVEEVLQGVAKLIIVTDGPLAYIPFEALVSDNVIMSDFRSTDYLVNRFEVRYLWSAQFLKSTTGAPPSMTNRLLVFAPDSFVTEPALASVRSLGGDTLRSGVGMTGLPGAAQEARTVGSLMGGRLFQGNTATETNFKTSSENSDILYLATHSLVDDSDPLQSCILFSPEDGENDGRLYSWEIMGMNVSARLAVLSSCNTGYGPMNRGEGVASLGRAFSYAGCPSVIMSYWPVEDLSTMNLMTSLFRKLEGGQRVSTALANAKRELLQTVRPGQAHPYYWAGMVLIGDDEVVVTTRDGRPRYWFLFPVILLTLVIVVVVVGRRHSSSA